MVDAVKRLGKIYSSDHCARRRLVLVESHRDFCGQRNKCRDRRAPWGEAVLGGGPGKVRKNEGADKAFKKFRGRAEEGDRAVGGAHLGGVSRFKDREDEGLLPDGREIGRGKGEVKEVSEERETKGAKMFKVEVGEGVRAYGRGILEGSDDRGDRLGGERGERGIKGAFLDGA